VWLLVRIAMLFLEHKRWIIKGRNRNESKRGLGKAAVKSSTAHLHTTAPLTAIY